MPRLSDLLSAIDEAKRYGMRRLSDIGANPDANVAQAYGAYVGDPMRERALRDAESRSVMPQLSGPARDAIQREIEGGLVGMAAGGKSLPASARNGVPMRSITVNNPVRVDYPGIYKRPDVIAAEAAARVAPENEALKRLFGVNRNELYEATVARGPGNIEPVLPGAAANPTGSAAATNVMTRRNENRLIDVLSEAEKYPQLTRGMDAWYNMDPVYQRMVQLVGPEEAKARFTRLNTLSGMASPGSDVLTELNRGTAANMLAEQGRFGDFLTHGGMSVKLRGPDYPADMRAVQGHAYHKTAQAKPMGDYLTTGAMQMESPKVPMYIQASGTPETGFQTRMPVGDAHWSRGVGLADVRTNANPGASVSTPEMSQLGPWWRDRVAAQVGLESVPAQARAWGAFAPQTGVGTPIAAPKLELLAQQIMKASQRMGVTPEQARDMILMGRAHAGAATPGTMGLAAGAGAGGAVALKYLNGEPSQ